MMLFTQRCRAALVVGIAAIAVGVAGCGSDDDSGNESAGKSGSTTADGGTAKKLSIGVMASSPQDDEFNGMNIAALKAAIKNIGEDRFEPVKVVDNVEFGPKATSTAKQLFQQGADVVIDQMSSGPLFYEACSAFPKKHCLELYPLGKPPANVSGWYLDALPMEYLQGVAAGKLTKNGSVGFVNSFKIGAQIAQLNSFTLGCQSVRPDCKVRNVYTNSYSNPPKATEATKTLVDAGVDVINHWQDEPSVLKTAGAAGVWSFALFQDYGDVAADRFVTTQLWQESMQRVWEQELRAMLEGTWTGDGRVNFGTPDGELSLKLGPWGKNVPEDVVKAVEAAHEKIAAGEGPFVGPIKDTKGKVRVPEGETVPWRTGFIYDNWSWPVAGTTGG